MGHIVCGYPSFDANWEILEEMEKAGVDVVEMQFPFSEPIADGPLFLTANQESLKKGTKIENCFTLMKKANAAFSFKTLMMGYYNTLFKNREDVFCHQLKDNGGSGMIVPDLPFEEAETLLQHCTKCNLSFIRLVAPTNTKKSPGYLADSIPLFFRIKSTVSSAIFCFLVITLKYKALNKKVNQFFNPPIFRGSIRFKIL